MLRELGLMALVAMAPAGVAAQAPGVLHITVTLTDAARGATPIPRYALLISDNPATSTPRRVVTGADGTAVVRLPPGNYTVESDEPVTFNGKGYEWAKTVDIAAGAEVVLELNAGNADVGDAGAPGTAKADSPSLLLPRWQDSVVAIWTPESRASGFVVDRAGLVVTSRRALGGATVVEVQVTPAIKVAARVLAADRTRDAAVLWIDPAAVAAITPVPLDCASGAKPPFTDRLRTVSIGVPLSGPKELAPGDVTRVDPREVVADFRLAPGSTGGPVFSADGTLIGLTSIVDTGNERASRDARIVPAGEVCAAVAAGEKAMRTAARPVATHLPVEPLRAFPAPVPDAANQARTAPSSPYLMSSSDFDIAFLTPTMGNAPAAGNFGPWTDYFATRPAVLAIRVTPKFEESFWTTLARGAAYTQGVALPPIKHFKPGFARLRAFCGDAEVTPIHPLVLEQRLSDTDAVREGLYIFAPDSLGPQCKSVRVVVSSEKDPQRSDSRVVDPKIVEQIWQDFAPFRAQPPAI